MARTGPFTIVIPTHNDPAQCQLVLESLIAENAAVQLDLRVVFLANDTLPGATERLEEIASGERYAALEPRVWRARSPWPVSEGNVRHTLGENLNEIAAEFLIIGNTDRVSLAVLKEAWAYLLENQLDLLLVGIINREAFRGKPMRHLYFPPRHMFPKNHLLHGKGYGTTTFADAMLDNGPIDYLSFIGCQIYTHKFFREMCALYDEFPESLYVQSIATLELTMRKDWQVGFFPSVVVVRVYVLPDDGSLELVNNDRYRTDRGLSRHTFLCAVTNSLYLSQAAFSIFVNSQSVSLRFANPQYMYSNVLWRLASEFSGMLAGATRDPTCRYTAGEMQDVVAFARRLRTVDIGLRAEQKELVCAWIEQFDMLGDYKDPGIIKYLVATGQGVLGLLDVRKNMERWLVHLFAV
jgi:hypothetical protein